MKKLHGNTGKKLSKEHKRKISKALKGRKLSEEHKRKLRDILIKKMKNGFHPMKGTLRTKETRIKLRKSKLGNKNPAWQGGISFGSYGLEFDKELKERIRQRDNYTCQECNYTQKQLGYKLPIHHIDYDKKNNKEDNLISLCKSCHQKTNFGREDWIEYLGGKIQCGRLFLTL